MAVEEEEDDDWFVPNKRMVAAHKLLQEQGLIVPLDLDDPSQVRLWQDMDLAIMIEECFAVPCDPRRLAQDDATRAGWLERLGDAHHVPRFRDRGYGIPYWLMRQGARAGIIYLGTYPRGPDLMPVTSLYVLPEHRRAGVAGTALRAAQQALVQNRCRGVWLDTYWVWQQNVDYYLRHRFWLYMWKRDLTLFWADYLPAGYEFEIDAERARFRIIENGSAVDFYEAGRDGDLLRLAKCERARAADAAHDYNLLSSAEGTFGLALARAGWPLYQKEGSKTKGWIGDGGNTEGLAPRIKWWEALANHRGWVVQTPRVPGIDYRSYEDLTREDEAVLPAAADGDEAQDG